MLDLLHKTLLYIEEQNEWLLQLQSAIAQKEHKYKVLHSLIINQITEELNKNYNTEFYNDDHNEQSDLEVKCEPQDYDNETYESDCVNELVSNNVVRSENDHSNILQNNTKIHANVTITLPDNLQQSELILNVNEDTNIEIEPSYVKIEEDLNAVDNDHVRMHSENISTVIDDEKRWKSSQCSKAFQFKSSLNKHLLIHTGEKPFKCEYCVKSFKVKSKLTAHVRAIHLHKKSFNCQYCSKSFSWKYRLITHMRTHTGEKPFKCDYCVKSFSVKSNFNAHVREIHFREKSFNCPNCSKSFLWKSRLLAHMRTHAGENTFK